jgi:PAS domain S-box-containing protein
MQNTKNMTRIISWLTGFIIGATVLIIPGGYAVTEYRYMAGSLETEVEIDARDITQIINANPKMWEFEQARFETCLSSRPATGASEIRRLFNLKNELLAESADRIHSPIIKRSAKLFDAGQAIGRVEIHRSLLPLIIKAVLLMLVMALLGAVVFIGLRIAPIRALRLSEYAIQKERDTSQKYLDIAGVLLVAINAEHKVTMINKRGCETVELPEEKIVGRNWFDDFVPETSREHAKWVFEQMRERTSQGQIVHQEGPIRVTRDRERVISWNHIALTDERGAFAGVLSSGEDITNHKQLENQLRHAQKMEAIGILAGGIAHDFNNILAVIIGFAYILQTKLGKNDPLQHEIEQILSSSERASQLVKSLLAYSRKQLVVPRIVEVNGIVGQMKSVLSRVLREDIEIRTVLSAKDLVVRADPGQIEQVLMNLASNAMDAMPGGGLLSMETGRVEIDESFCGGHGYGIPGLYALITVSDTGTGMSEQTKEKIFDPFFTTKEVGKGTGLGLSMAYGIIKQHKGYINAYSEPGRGTTFKLYLPLAQGENLYPEPEGVHYSSGGTETILIAEDDAAVRRMTVTVLKNAGYTVIEAADGEDAIRQFTDCKRAIHLVLLDVIMPRMNGNVVYDEIRKTAPDMKVLFMSGYTADMLMNKMLTGSNVNFLLKPASPRLLLKTVRDALDA